VKAIEHTPAAQIIKIAEELFQAIYDLKYYIDVQPEDVCHLGKSVATLAAYGRADDLLKQKDALIAQIASILPRNKEVPA